MPIKITTYNKLKITHLKPKLTEKLTENNLQVQNTFDFAFVVFYEPACEAIFIRFSLINIIFISN